MGLCRRLIWWWVLAAQSVCGVSARGMVVDVLVQRDLARAAWHEPLFSWLMSFAQNKLMTLKSGTLSPGPIEEDEKNNQ